MKWWGWLWTGRPDDRLVRWGILGLIPCLQLGGDDPYLAVLAYHPMGRRSLGLRAGCVARGPGVL